MIHVGMTDEEEEEKEETIAERHCGMTRRNSKDDCRDQEGFGWSIKCNVTWLKTFLNVAAEEWALLSFFHLFLVCWTDRCLLHQTAIPAPHKHFARSCHRTCSCIVHHWTGTNTPSSSSKIAYNIFSELKRRLFTPKTTLFTTITIIQHGYR